MSQPHGWLFFLAPRFGLLGRAGGLPHLGQGEIRSVESDESGRSRALAGRASRAVASASRRPPSVMKGCLITASQKSSKRGGDGSVRS